MKVLSVTPTFFPKIGGIETVVAELALQMRKLGVEMDVAHVATEHKSFSVEDVNGIQVFRVPLYGHRLIGLAPALGKLSRDYDLLHVHDPQLLAISASVRSFCSDLPAVLSTHGGFNHTAKLSLFKRIYEKTLLKSMLGHYQEVLATSVGDELYFKQFSSRVALCSNGVHVEKFSRVPAWESSEKLKNTRRWIYWGRLSKNKRIDLLIDYVALAKKLGFLVELLICGQDFDGLSNELMAKVKSLGLDEQIKFEAFLSDQDLLSELSQRGVFITASEHEGFGLSVVEAMAAGLIVICRDMVPLNSFITHDASGFFLNFDGKEHDQNTLKKLLSMDQSKGELITSQARLLADEYDWRNAAKVFLRHFQSVLQIQVKS